MDCQSGAAFAVDEAAVHLQVGEGGEVVRGLGVDEAGFELFNGWMATRHGGNDLGEGIGDSRVAVDLRPRGRLSRLRARDSGTAGR